MRERELSFTNIYPTIYNMALINHDKFLAHSDNEIKAALFKETKDINKLMYTRKMLRNYVDHIMRDKHK